MANVPRRDNPSSKQDLNLTMVILNGGLFKTGLNISIINKS